MTQKHCNRCNCYITWPEYYIKGQRPLNLDGSIHSCILTKTSDVTSNQTIVVPIQDIVAGHTKLFAKLIQRIDTLEERILKND